MRCENDMPAVVRCALAQDIRSFTVAIRKMNAICLQQVRVRFSNRALDSLLKIIKRFRLRSASSVLQSCLYFKQQRHDYERKNCGLLAAPDRCGGDWQSQFFAAFAPKSKHWVNAMPLALVRKVLLRYTDSAGEKGGLFRISQERHCLARHRLR